MAHPMRLNLIVALDKSGGIGLQGSIPWTLRGDLQHFKKLTSTVKDPTKKNAVVMGRKTWFSIPEKNRPLPRRINLILSQSLKHPIDGAPDTFVFDSFDGLMEALHYGPFSQEVESVWIIGGHSIYQHALDSEFMHRMYLTHVASTFSCDTFFPSYSRDNFKVAHEEGIPEELQEENGLQFRYEILEKI